MEITGDFNAMNKVYAKHQPEYLPLPVHCTEEGDATSCWKLSWTERLKVLIYGRVYVTQLTFNQPLQPLRVKTEFPVMENILMTESNFERLFNNGFPRYSTEQYVATIKLADLASFTPSQRGLLADPFVDNEDKRTIILSQSEPISVEFFLKIHTFIIEKQGESFKEKTIRRMVCRKFKIVTL